jgi:hypothetical protein
LQLIVAGRILLIFEGFDEMAYASVYEERIEHFRVLWQFAYERSKILFTGRPNFFLDDAEMRSALGIGSRELGEPSDTVNYGPHCECIRLRPFSPDQVRQSLRRWADPDVTDGIVNIALSGGQAAEIVSRPSLLYIVAVLWKTEAFQTDKSDMSSAKVIGQFI